jgi:hypothetical protein
MQELASFPFLDDWNLSDGWRLPFLGLLCWSLLTDRSELLYVNAIYNQTCLDLLMGMVHQQCIIAVSYCSVSVWSEMLTVECVVSA